MYTWSKQSNQTHCQLDSQEFSERIFSTFHFFVTMRPFIKVEIGIVVCLAHPHHHIDDINRYAFSFSRNATTYCFFLFSFISILSTYAIFVPLDTLLHITFFFFLYTINIGNFCFSIYATAYYFFLFSFISILSTYAIFVLPNKLRYINFTFSYYHL